jgi:hypothetical protein
MSLLYLSPILKALSFWEKILALFKKIYIYALLKFFWSLILEALSFDGKNFGLYFKKMSLKLKKGLIKFS